MTDHKNEHSDAIQKRVADEGAAREKTQAEHRDAMAGVKPTPTQEENDRAALGEHVEPEPDGSPPDTGMLPPAGQSSGGYASREAKPGETKPLSTHEAKPATQQRGDYSTRAAAPAKHE